MHCTLLAFSTVKKIEDIDQNNTNILPSKSYTVLTAISTVVYYYNIIIYTTFVEHFILMLKAL